MRISECIDDFLAYLTVEKGDVKATIDTYTDDLNQFKEFMADCDVKDLKRDDSLLMVIDDDPRNLKEIHELNSDVILLKDTVLID